MCISLMIVVTVRRIGRRIVFGSQLIDPDSSGAVLSDRCPRRRGAARIEQPPVIGAAASGYGLR
jgi:hypothetical protein